MKKIILFALSALLLSCTFALPAIASESASDYTDVFVTISDGTLVLAHEKVSVKDSDNDGAVTINDALICAHSVYYKNGESGYDYANGDYGLYITKLWGKENGSGYGYYLNNASAFSLGDEISDGSYVCAFLYTDTVNFSDVYCYFDKSEINTEKGEEFALTLTAAGYDENWAPMTYPLANTAITIDGNDTGLVTDENGKVTLSVNYSGKHTVSAKSGALALVPPVCAVTVPNTGIGFVWYAIIAATVIILAFAFVLMFKKQKH